MKGRGSGGYTLIELLLAMALFSTMLLLITLGFLYSIRLYRNGLSSRDSQSSTTFGMEEIMRDTREAYAVGVQNLSTVSPNPNPNDRLCLRLPGRDVMYQVNSAVLTRYNAVITVTGGAITCLPSVSPPAPAPQVVSGASAVVLGFSATPNTPAVGPGVTPIQSVTITLRGSGSSLNAASQNAGSCTPTDTTSGFCATTQITSTASLRGRQEQQ